MSVAVATDLPILVVSGDEGDHCSQDGILQRDCRMHRAAARKDAVSLIREHHPKVVICDQTLADGDWRDLLADLLEEKENTPLIVSSRLADDRLWAEVLNLGGYDLLTKPFAAGEVSRVVRMASRRSQPNRH